MPVYQIHRMKSATRQQFRWAPHTSGLSMIKLKDYEPGELIEAATVYAAWLALKETDCPLGVGDVLEADGQLRILKYVGFEEARWWQPEPSAAPVVADSTPSSVSCSQNS
jgi:hypothetical protein